jgi:hypothetical protein
MKSWEALRRFLKSESVRGRNVIPPGKRANSGVKELGCVFLFFLLYVAVWEIATHWKVAAGLVLYAEDALDRLISPRVFWALIAVWLILSSLKELRVLFVLLTEIRDILRRIESQARYDVETREILRRIERQLISRPR